jgi:predicted Zn-dependent protease
MLGNQIHECETEGRWFSAAVLLGQQIRQDPEDATLYCRRGHAYAEQGKRKEAAADFAEFFRRTAPVLP